MKGMLRRGWVGLGAVAGLLVSAGVAAPATADQPVMNPPERMRELLADSRRALEANPKLEYDPYTVLVRFKDDAPDLARGAARGLVGGEVVRTYSLVPGLEHLRVSVGVADAITMLRLMPGVEFAEPDYTVHAQVTPNDTYFSQGLLWGLNNTGQTVNGDPGIADADIDAPEAWDTFTGDPNFIIAGIDSGVNYNHPDLAGNVWTNSGEIPGNGIDDDGNGYVDDVHGYDFYNGDGNPIDDNGHGTHTAGTFGAVGNNGVGVTGVNWHCRIMALKFLNSAGSGSTSGAIAALNYAVANGARISNNSWGGGGFSSSFSSALSAARTAGHLFVAAAGNSGTNNDSSPFYPASYTQDNIIAVASTTNNDTRSSFSNYGATGVDIGAPGSTILSTYQSGYAYLDGTSMATPHVTGVAALVWGASPGMTYAQVRTQLFSTARHITGLNGLCVTGGVVNAAAAVAGSPPPPPPTVPADPTNAGATEPSKGVVTVSWSDNSNNETGFQVERSQLVGGAWTNVTTLAAGANATSLADVPAPGQYRYRVRAFNASGDSGFTGYVELEPRDASGANTTMVGRTVTLHWLDNSNFESGFQFEHQRLLGSSWVTQATVQMGVNATSFARSCQPGQNRFRVAAKGPNGVLTSFTPYVVVDVP
jgi:serine protease